MFEGAKDFCPNFSKLVRYVASNVLPQIVAARGEIGLEGCEISSLVEHMGLSPWLFL